MSKDNCYWPLFHWQKNMVHRWKMMMIKAVLRLYEFTLDRYSLRPNISCKGGQHSRARRAGVCSVATISLWAPKTLGNPPPSSPTAVFKTTFSFQISDLWLPWSRSKKNCQKNWSFPHECLFLMCNQCASPYYWTC